MKNHAYCSKPACQRERKRRWERQKIADDPDYRDNQRDSQRRWRETHRDYWRTYRDSHPSDKGMKIRQMSRTLGISRNTIRTVIKETGPEKRGSGTSYDHEMPLIHEAFVRCRGNVVRVAEILEEKGIRIGYSTLTRIARDQGLRKPQKARAGAYTFGLGLEMQHDTSPHKVIMDGKPIIEQCAALILAYSRGSINTYFREGSRLRGAKIWST